MTWTGQPVSIGCSPKRCVFPSSISFSVMTFGSAEYSEGSLEATVFLDAPLLRRADRVPHQILGHVDGRGEKHEAGSRSPSLRSARRFARRSAIQPPIDEPIKNLRAVRRVEDRLRFFQPAGDGAVLELPARLAVAGIVEARHRRARAPRPMVERLRLGALHVGTEAAEPEEPGALPRARGWRYRGRPRPHRPSNVSIPRRSSYSSAFRVPEVREAQNAVKPMTPAGARKR